MDSNLNLRFDVLYDLVTVAEGDEKTRGTTDAHSAA
jgi:hypothetical protein